MVNAIRPAGLANQKGPRIQKVLKEITKERGDLDLWFLKDLPLEEARAWLMKFNGVGPKTAAIVLCFSLNRPAFPVDTHIYRVTGRIGLRPETMTVEQAHPHLEKLFPPETYYAAHLNLIRLGREVCHARKPDCPKCPIKRLCDYEPKTNDDWKWRICHDLQYLQNPQPISFTQSIRRSSSIIRAARRLPSCRLNRINKYLLECKRQS